MAEPQEATEDALLQQALGFSTFGSQNPKKRKLSLNATAAPPPPTSALPPAPASLPPRPRQPQSLPQQQERGGGQGHGQGQGQGQRRKDGPWWKGYYDPTSNENPWAELERAAGVGERGTWLEKGHGYSGGSLRNPGS